MGTKTQKKIYKGGNVLVPFSLLAALLASKKTKKCKKCKRKSKKCKAKANKRGGNNNSNPQKMQFLNNNNNNTTKIKSFSEWEFENNFFNVSKRLLNAAKFKSNDTGTIKGSL